MRPDSIFPVKPADVDPIPPAVVQVDETHDPRTYWVRLNLATEKLIFSSALPTIAIEPVTGIG